MVGPGFRARFDRSEEERMTSLQIRPGWYMALATALAVAVSSMPTPVEAGKLGRVRAQTKSGSSKKKSSSDDSSYDDDSHHHRRGDSVMAFYVVTAPWWGPHTAIGDRFGRVYAYPGHPYQGSNPGYLRYATSPIEPGVTRSGRRELGKAAALRVRTEGGPVDDGLTRWGFAARLSTNFRLELETAWSQYAEPMPDGGVDQLWLGDANMILQFAQNEHVQFHSGIGVRGMIDRPDSVWGFNFTYGVDLYPTDPIVISADMDLGHIGAAGVVQLRATIGMMLSFVELYGGYDALWVGDESLGGPVVGLRGWL